MNNVLDDDFLKSEKDDSRLNKITYIIRYALCAFIIVTEGRKSFSELEKVYASTNNFLSEAFIFYFLGFLAMVLYIVYNFIHAKKEKSVNFYISNINRSYSFMFIGYSVILSAHYIRLVLFSVENDRGMYNIISFAVVFVMIIYLLLREFIYLKRNKSGV